MWCHLRFRHVVFSQVPWCHKVYVCCFRTGVPKWECLLFPSRCQKKNWAVMFHAVTKCLVPFSADQFFLSHPPRNDGCCVVYCDVESNAINSSLAQVLSVIVMHCPPDKQVWKYNRFSIVLLRIELFRKAAFCRMPSNSMRLQGWLHPHICPSGQWLRGYKRFNFGDNARQFCERVVLLLECL